MGILRFFLIFIIVSYLIIYLIGIIGKWAVKRWLNKMQDPNNKQTTNKKEGEVTVNFGRKTQRKHFNKDDGEYVDYEEVK